MKFKLLYTFIVLFFFASIQIIGQTQFVKHINNPIFSGTPNTWDGYAVVNSSITFDGEKYCMYYTSKPNKLNSLSLYNNYIGRVCSKDGMNWQKDDSKPIVNLDEKWEQFGFSEVIVLYVNSIWHMWYTCPTDERFSDTYLGYAISNDGISWEKDDVLGFSKSKAGWDSGGIFPLSIIHDGSKFIMYYKAYSIVRMNAANKKYAIGIAESLDGYTWIKDKVNNPVIEFRDARRSDFRLGNLSVIFNEGNTDQPYQMWYIGSNNAIDENQYVFHATSPNGKIWSKNSKSILNSKDESWARYGFQDIEIVQEGKKYKMWMNGIVDNSETGAVLGYAEDFSNTAHLTCVGCNVKYRPRVFKSWINNSSKEKVYVWGKIECFNGEEVHIYSMYLKGGENCYEIEDKIHCSGEKFYFYSSFITSDPMGENVIFDSKNFYADKFTTVPMPKVEVVELEKSPKGDYRARLKMNNISKSTAIINPKVKVTAANGLIDLNIPEKISFNNVEAESSEYSYSYIEFELKFPGIYLNLDLDIYSEEVLYWSDTLRQIPTDIINVFSQLPDEFSLAQNYPNPFNPSTTIKYTIPNVGKEDFRAVQLKIYDVLGGEVETLVNKSQKAGYYEVNWNAVNNSSGVYFYRIQAGEFVETKKMLLLR